MNPLPKMTHSHIGRILQTVVGAVAPSRTAHLGVLKSQQFPKLELCDGTHLFFGQHHVTSVAGCGLVSLLRNAELPSGNWLELQALSLPRMAPSVLTRTLYHPDFMDVGRGSERLNCLLEAV